MLASSQMAARAFYMYQNIDWKQTPATKIYKKGITA